MKYRVNLLSLDCLIPNETGLDEIFLKWKGNKIWPESARFQKVQIGSQSLRVALGLVPADEKICIELWDHDTFTPNDRLGDFVLLPDKLGTYSTELTSKNGSQVYTLLWEVD